MTLLKEEQSKIQSLIRSDERAFTVTITGPRANVERALVYIQCLVQQKEGAVVITEDLAVNDLTMMDVPQDAV